MTFYNVEILTDFRGRRAIGQSKQTRIRIFGATYLARILAIHAHPDDIEFLAAGTLALLADTGNHDIVFSTLTSGDKGSHDLSAPEISALRRKEAASAAAVIGAQYLPGDFLDQEIFSDNASRHAVVELLRKTRPDIVLTASPVDYSPDHEATSLLVRDACFAAGSPNYKTDSPSIDGIPELYLMDPLGGIDRSGDLIDPDFIVDITDKIAVKRAMLEHHQSQRAWLKAHHHMDDYVNQMEIWSAERGKRIGVAFGEGFRRYRGHPFPQNFQLESFLADRLVKRA